MDRRILHTVAVKFSGGPVGLDTIAHAIGGSPDVIEDTHEPFLISRASCTARRRATSSRRAGARGSNGGCRCRRTERTPAAAAGLSGSVRNGVQVVRAAPRSSTGHPEGPVDRRWIHRRHLERPRAGLRPARPLPALAPRRPRRRPSPRAPPRPRPHARRRPAPPPARARRRRRHRADPPPAHRLRHLQARPPRRQRRRRARVRRRPLGRRCTCATWRTATTSPPSRWSRAEPAARVASVHLRWQPRDTPDAAHLGRRQLLEVLDRLDAIAPGVPRLVGGDFNALSDGVVLQAAQARARPVLPGAAALGHRRHRRALPQSSTTCSSRPTRWRHRPTRSRG
ncbi:MAG: Holliday junction DNA helicase RuvB C-terminal domain-containing protein [Myxococcota bacterium]